MLYDPAPGAGGTEPESRGTARPAQRLFVTLLALVAVALLVWFVLDRKLAARDPAVSSAHADESVPAAPVPPTSPAAEPSAAPAALDGSDTFVRDALSGLSNRREWAIWLAGEDLVRRAVAAVAAVAEGRSPRFAFDTVPLPGRFAVTFRRGRWYVEESSYERFDGIATMARSLDPAVVRAAWLRIRPLAERAWAEIAPDERPLDQVTTAAVDHLLATPQTRGSVEVIADGAIYRFADPRLEAASPAQKLLLRMGAANAGAISELLRSLRTLLESAP